MSPIDIAFVCFGFSLCGVAWLWLDVNRHNKNFSIQRYANSTRYLQKDGGYEEVTAYTLIHHETRTVEGQKE